MATSNETATYIGDLPTSPTVPVDATSGGRSRGGAEIRKTKAIMKATFPSCTGAVTATHTELNILDGVTATTAELNILDGVTSTAAELNILDGVTATAAELNILDGVTSTAAELNVLDGVTAFIDDDSMATASATNIPSAESVKAYVDASPGVTQGSAVTLNPYATSGDATAAHGLGATPTFIQAYFECLSTEHGYAVGDRVQFDMDGPAGFRGIAYGYNSTNVFLAVSDGNVSIPPKTGGVVVTLTASKWKLVVVPFLVS